MLLIGTYSSCSLFDKLDDVKFDTDFYVTFNVNETEENPLGKSYSTEQILDILDDPDIRKYSDKIKEVKVNRISYFVFSVSGSGVNTSGGSLSMSPNKTIATLPSQPVTEGASGDLSIDVAGFTELGNRLKANKQETIRLSGNLSKTPVSFAVETRFYVTVTAEALK